MKPGNSHLRSSTIISLLVVMIACSKPVSSDLSKLRQFYIQKNTQLGKKYVMLIPLTGCKGCITAALNISRNLNCDSVDVILVKRNVPRIPNEAEKSCILHDSLDYMFYHYLIDDLPVLYIVNQSELEKQTLDAESLSLFVSSYRHLITD